MMGRVLAVIGGQYGSEGKGVIAAHLADRFDVHVRVGGPNAGHSFADPRYGLDHDRFKVWKMRSLPCGWVNPNATLVIGAGAVVDLDLLMREIAETGVEKERVFVDPRVVLIEPEDRDPTYVLKESIGATGEGVGPARQRRLARRGLRTVGEVVLKNALGMKGAFGPIDDEWPFEVGDTVELLDQARNQGRSILLEGTQGSGLSLIHGAWPYVTSADTGTAQLCADCGVAPAQVESLLVVRSYPIRVGGNSGPLRNELSWDALSGRVGRPVREFTTVTGRERRVGEWDARLVRKAIMLNRPASVALMFLDYLFPEEEGCGEWTQLSSRAMEWVLALQGELQTYVEFVGTGGPRFAVIERNEP